MRNFIHFFIAGVLLLSTLPCAADIFSAQDDSFTLDMPAGWTRIKNPPQRSVLSVQKGEARIDIKTVDCTTEACLEKMIRNDVADIKAKQMNVIKNTYTDEEIKRIEFSTGEPFFYISFYTPQNDFSAGYFLIDNNGYSILSKNLTYAETDLIFASISPTAVSSNLEDAVPLDMDIEETNSSRSYDTQAMPDVEVANLDAFSTRAAQGLHAATGTSKNAGFFKKALRKVKNKWKRWPLKTLVRPAMPPFIRQMGHGFDALMLLITLFFGVWCGAGIVRLFVQPLHIAPPANPQSFYPIKLQRRYGTPSLIFRAKDNQGNILTALCVRWDALFMFFGIVMMLLSVIIMTGASVCEQLHLIKASAFAYNTLYAGFSLVLPLGFVILFCGIVWGQIAMTEITLFDHKGEKAAVILQKGYSLSNERYQLYFARSKELLLAERKRFSLKRRWKLLSKDRIEFARFEERSAHRAVWRMLCGHLWGMLRADYDIYGAMDSKGVLQNSHALFNKSVCNIDKPEAVNARDLLAISLLISIRDRDKWYPWFN